VKEGGGAICVATRRGGGERRSPKGCYQLGKNTFYFCRKRKEKKRERRTCLLSEGSSELNGKKRRDEPNRFYLPRERAYSLRGG